MRALISGEISQGEALKALRINVLGLKQDAFAKMVSVSRKTLSEVENDKGNYTSDVINKLFKPFGLKVGLVPVSQQVLSTLFFNKQ
jgi:DNA-binding XRE family transcriptional regulator